MVMEEKIMFFKKYRWSIIFCSILLVIFGYAITVGAKPQDDNDPVIVNNQIEYAGKVWTNTPEEKYLPALSLDGSHIAFVYKMFTDKSADRKAGIIELATGKVSDITLQGDEYSTAWEYVSWIDSNNVGVIGHINPSLEALSIININSMISENTTFGVGFSWNTATQKMYYNLPKPHFGEGEKGKNQIMDTDGTIYYESPENVIILGGPNFNPTGTEVAFFEASLKTNEVQLVIAKNDGSKQLIDVKKEKWGFETGKIQWKDNQTIDVRTLYKWIEYSLDQHKITNERDTPEQIEFEKNQT
jgi:hypothetical protein